jgi:hypothetical protein
MDALAGCLQPADSNPDSGGEGVFHDANSALGGPFIVAYWNTKVGPAEPLAGYRSYGQWSVKLEFCGW